MNSLSEEIRKQNLETVPTEEQILQEAETKVKDLYASLQMRLKNVRMNIFDLLVPKSNNTILATTLITRDKVSLSLTPETIKKLDKARGDVNRSLFVTRMVERLSL